jgi:hypothetical protein
MSQQERRDLVTLYPVVTNGCLAGSDQIADRFVIGIWNPHGGQVASAQRPRQTFCVAAVGLDVVSGAGRDERWRDDDAGLPEIGDCALQSVSCRSRLIAEMELLIAGRRLGDQLPRCLWRVGDLAKEPDLTCPASFGDGHRIARF